MNGSGISKRLENELKRINSAQRNNKLPPHWIYLGPRIDSNGLPNYTIIDFCWLGVTGNIKGGVYNAEFHISHNLEEKGPEVKMLDGFEHMHVYGHGRVCFPFCDKLWRSSNTLIDIANELEKMLDQPPNPKDSANVKMDRFYSQGIEVYYQFIRDQAKQFANKKSTNRFS